MPKFINFRELASRKLMLMIILMVALFYPITTYYLINNAVAAITARAEIRFKIAQNFINSSLVSANQILYGISLAVTKENTRVSYKDISNLIKCFDQKLDRHKFISFSGFKVVDSNDDVIVHTLIPNEIFTPKKNIKDTPLINLARNHPLEPQVGDIRFGNLTHTFSIPICISTEKNNKTVNFTICGCLSLQELSNKLDLHLEDKNILKIELLPLNSKEDNGHRIHNSFTFSKIMLSAIKDESIILYQPLTVYPASLKVEVNCYHLSREIAKVAAYPLCYLLIIVFLIHSLSTIHKQNYKKPYDKLRDKLNENSTIFSKKIPEFSHKINSPCNTKLFQPIEGIIDYCILLHKNFEQLVKEKPIQELRQKIFNLILTEHHFSKTNKCNTEFGTLYLNKLEELNNSKEEDLNLEEFLEELIDYSIEYYSELNLKLVIKDYNKQNFTIKKEVFAETIFSIFTAITRIGKFNTDNQVILRYDLNENDSPVIYIEVESMDGSSQALGWEHGPSCVYSCLFPIYLLAKENNYFFYITQSNNVIIFILQPFDSEVSKSTRELCSRLSFDRYFSQFFDHSKIEENKLIP